MPDTETITISRQVLASLVNTAGAREGQLLANSSGIGGPQLPPGVMRTLIELHRNTPDGYYAGVYVAELLRTANADGGGVSLDDLWAANDFSNVGDLDAFKKALRVVAEAYEGSPL